MLFCLSLVSRNSVTFSTKQNNSIQLHQIDTIVFATTMGKSFGCLHFFCVRLFDHFFYLGNLVEKRILVAIQIDVSSAFSHFIASILTLLVNFFFLRSNLTFLLQLFFVGVFTLFNFHFGTQTTQNSDLLFKCSKAVKQKILIYYTFIDLHTHIVLCVCGIAFNFHRESDLFLSPFICIFMRSSECNK